MLFSDKGYNSFEELYMDNEKLVFTFIRDHTENEPAIEEIAQIVWFKIFSNYEKIPKDSTKKTKNYIRAIAYHAVADYFEEEKKRTNLFDEMTLFFKEEAEETIETEIYEFCNRELEEYLNESMEVLNETEKHLIRLWFYDKLTSPVIGQILGMSDGVVRVKISRILKKLRKEIKAKQRRDEYGR